MRASKIFASVAAVTLVGILFCGPAAALDPAWKILKPSSSGVPGELIHFVRFAPDGKIWVAARWPFWGEGGIGIYDRATDAWTVLSNWETPIPSEYLNDLEFGADGTAWLATDLGLVRFDGVTWTVYDPTNSPMQLYKVRRISIAPDGHIWINNSDFNAGGDAIYDFDGMSTWRSFRVPDELPWAAPWEDLSEVFVASDGHVWVANDTLGGVAEYDGSTWTLRGGSLGPLDEMAEDQFGNIWINANGVGGDYAFFRWNGATFTRYPFASPTTLSSDPDTGTIYVGNWNGDVVRTSNGGATFQTYLSGLNHVFSIAPDPAGTDVWIGTIGAVGHFLGDGSWVRDYNSHNTGMPDYFVDYMATLRDGYFWVATGEMGLSRSDGVRWRNWGNHNAGSEPYPFAGNEPMGGAYQDRNGTHWFGGNGIARWDSESGQFTGFWNWENNPGMGVTLFPFFAEDASGHLFAASEYGSTYRFDVDAELWVLEPVQPYAVLGLPGMKADSAGNVWIAAWFDIHKWDGSTWSKVTLPDPNYFFNLGGISAFDIGPGDVMWFATFEGVVRWDGTTFTLFDSTNTPIPAGYVSGIAVRDDGLVGLAVGASSASSGVALIDGDPADPASWSVFPYGQSPLPHWQTWRVAFDPKGNLWVSATSEGVAVLLTGALEACMTPTVDAASGAPSDTLIVNDSTGGVSRTVVAAEGGPIRLVMLAAPAGGSGQYLVHANLGLPTADTMRVLPKSIGTFCFPIFLAENQPDAVWNNIGKPNRVGASNYFGTPIPDPPAAPAIFLDLPAGDVVHLPAGTTITLQGVLIDPVSPSPKGASTTNAVVVEVE